MAQDLSRQPALGAYTPAVEYARSPNVNYSSPVLSIGHVNNILNKATRSTNNEHPHHDLQQQYRNHRQPQQQQQHVASPLPAQQQQQQQQQQLIQFQFNSHPQHQQYFYPTHQLNNEIGRATRSFQQTSTMEPKQKQQPPQLLNPPCVSQRQLMQMQLMAQQRAQSHQTKVHAHTFPQQQQHFFSEL